MLKTTLAIGITLLLAGTADAAQLRGVAGACLADVKSLCEGVQPGQGRIRSCVKTHIGELSAPCQALLAKAAAVKACRGDAKKFCADVKPGGGAIASCIKSHMTEVSDPCKEAMAKAGVGKN